jgi:cytochrome c5
MRIKRVFLGVSVTLAIAATAVGVFAGVESSAYEASLDKVYDVPLPEVARSTDPAVVARGKHVVEAIAGCTSASCHGPDLGGGRTQEMGPLGKFTGPNISSGSLGAAYSDGELARLIQHGVKRDGRSVRFMPVQDFRWLPDDDVAAAVSYMRSLPAVDRPNGPVAFTTLAKVLDRRDVVVIDVARRIDHAASEAPPPPSASAAYGRFLANACTGCHGEHLSGGRIPGAPPSLPVPTDLTPHDEGLARWTFGDFDRVLTVGIKPDGRKLDPFMPIDVYGKLDDAEKHALWAYMQSLPPRPFGQR